MACTVICLFVERDAAVILERAKPRAKRAQLGTHTRHSWPVRDVGWISHLELRRRMLDLNFDKTDRNASGLFCFRALATSWAQKRREC